MTKDLQDLAWSCLPKEFKEEVKKYYDNSPVLGAKAVLLLENLFGIHNLTSDAEGEEMLSVSRKRVQGLYTLYQTYKQEERPIIEDGFYDGEMNALKMLFGSKCLTDETKDETKEPTPAEPKYHVEDWVRVVSIDKHGHIGQITEVEYEYGCNYYRVSGAEGWHFLEKNLEPYTEPKESLRQFYRIIGTDEHGRQVRTPIPSEVAGPYDISEERTEPKENHIPGPAKMADNIIKNGFSKERRLNIAAMAMQGLLASPVDADMQSKSADYIVRASFEYADALIAEAQKGGENE